jgi:L-2-hydroxyglutarate oxidase LhgO
MENGADAVIVGAGLVGLACARALAKAGLSVVVVERHARAGEETSSRNSGVIHSGIYYPAGSLKARLCVTGRQMLYAYCRERDIIHRRCGKLVVAKADQVEQLKLLRSKAHANGVTDVELLSEATARSLEPSVKCAAALLSPSTGIVDVHEYMLALIADIEAAGGILSFNTEFAGATTRDSGIVSSLRSGGETTDFGSRILVNAAGLRAVELLKYIDGYPSGQGHITWYAKGNYFNCQGVKPFTHLIYPMPNEASLGLHATLDLDGSTRFGPDVEWVGAIDYRVDPARAASFYASIREYWPALPDGALQPAYAGIRPKRVGPDSAAADFLIEGQAEHGVAGLLNLIGIESPGLTSSLAIAEEVSRRLLSNANCARSPAVRTRME